MPQISRRDFGWNAVACGFAGLHGSYPTASAASGRPFARLKAGFKGELFLPSSPAYETVRYSWNRRFDRHPVLIAVCANTDDVVRAFEYAVGESLPIAVRSGGHSLGALSTCDGGIVVDLGKMNAVRVDAKTRRLIAQPGARIGQVQSAAAASGLVANLPSSTAVGVAGVVLSAGIGGALNSLYGTSAGSLLAAECVLPDGRRATADQSQYADLLWGLHGAGANFAIATELTLRLFEPPQMYEFTVFCPNEAKADLVHRLQAAAAEHQERLDCGASAFGSAGNASHFLGMGSFFGNEADGKALSAKLIQGLKGASVQGKWTKFAAPLESGAARQHFACARWARNIGSLKDDAIAAFFNTNDNPPFERFVAMNMTYGADTRTTADAAAFSAREAGVDLGIWADAADPLSSQVAVSWTRDLWTLAGGEQCGGFPSLLMDEGSARIEKTYGRNYARLRLLKKKYDPGNLLRLNQNIVPA